MIGTSFYLPKDIYKYLHIKLNTTPPTSNILIRIDDTPILFKYDINKFYYLITILLNLKSYKIKVNKDGYFPFYSKLLIELIGNKYSDYLRYLNNIGFITTNDEYKVGRCKYYKVIIYDTINLFNSINNNSIYSFTNEDENSTLHTINKEVIKDLETRNFLEYITIKTDKNSAFYKKKKKEYQLQLDRIYKYPCHLKEMFFYFKKNLEIDYDKAILHCHDFLCNGYSELNNSMISGVINKNTFDKELFKLRNKYLARISSVENIHNFKKNKTLKFNRNPTNKRIDTNLTNMAKDLRPFIIGYENLCYLDLSNSQPLLFNKLLQNYANKGNTRLDNEIIEYFNLTIKGNFYEALQTILKFNNRDLTKESWMKIAYSKNTSYLTLKKNFAKKFPEIEKLIRKIKKKNYNQFAIQLQKIESDIFINQICKELCNHKIVPISIHDGVLVPKNKKEQTYQIMTNILENHLGEIPVISIDDIKTHP